MKQSNWVFGIVLTAMVFFASGCDNLAGGGDSNTDTDKDTSGGGSVDWTNYKTAGSFSIRIKNEANRDLVVFKNTVSKANILGGVRKNASDHGLKLDTKHFNENTGFSLIFITTED